MKKVLVVTTSSLMLIVLMLLESVSTSIAKASSNQFEVIVLKLEMDLDKIRDEWIAGNFSNACNLAYQLRRNVNPARHDFAKKHLNKEIPSLTNDEFNVLDNRILWVDDITQIMVIPKCRRMGI